MYESGTRLQERITNLASRPRRRRTAQRNGPSSEPERNRPRPPRAGPPLAVGARRRDRPDAQRDPRARRRAGRRGTRRPRSAPSPSARPAGPRRSSASNPHGAVVLSLEILVDSIAAAIVGPRRRDPRAACASTGRAWSCRSTTWSPTSPPSPASSGSRDDWPIVGIGVAVAGVVRRSDGLVSMAPNLGWVDVPLGARLARALATAVPIAVVNDADAGVARRVPARRGDRRRRRAVRLGRGRRGRRPDRRRPPAHGRRRVRRRDRPHDRQPGRRRRAAAARSAAGRPRSARACCSRSPAIPPTPGGPGSTPSCARPRPGSETAHRRPRPRRALAGHRARRPRQHPQPAARDPRRPARAGSTRSSADRSRRSSTAMRCRRPGPSSASSRRRSASTRRSSGRPRWPSSPCWPIRRPGSAAPATRFTWRAPDVDARIRHIDGIDRRIKTATGVKGVCLTM